MPVRRASPTGRPGLRPTHPPRGPALAWVTTRSASPARDRRPLVEFLQQAGCNALHIELAERGVHGNSHGSMFERNNAEVLAIVTDWMADQLG